MLQQKTKGLFVEVNDYSILAAVTSGLDAPLTIESVHEKPINAEPEELDVFFSRFHETKGRSFINARCGVYPKSRFVRRTTLESPAKARDPHYFAELVQTQFRIDPDLNMVGVVNATDGSEFDIEKGVQNQKELVFCGAGMDDLETTQERLVNWGLYPDRLELGSVVTLGGLISYSKFKKNRLPTLVLEITPTNSNIFIINSKQIDIARPIPYGMNSMFPTIQKELGLKDEDSARKLFYSDTFDFTDMGPVLLQRMLKELQASTGFYEVQTGQTVGQIFITLLPKNFHWIQNTLARSLGVDVLQIDFPGWLKQLDVTPSSNVQFETLGTRWVGLFSLMGQYDAESEG
jgi:hypothetical protein